MHSLSLLALFAASSLATKLLLPLYQYPEGTAYDPVYSTIEANPQLDFQIILNADSGPGGSQPDSAFVTATTKLTSFPNVQLLGYLHCLYGEASEDEVRQNATDWAAWNSYAGATLSIDGIFFDETPNSEGSAGDNDVAFMQSAVQAAASAFGGHEFTSMLNPGSSVAHDEYWDLADFIVIFEDEASAYSASVLTENVPSGRANQSAILIPEFASVGTSSEAQSWLEAMVEMGVGSAHILDYGYMDATSTDAPAPIGAVALALAGAQGNSASSATPAAAASSSPSGTDTTSTAATMTSPAPVIASSAEVASSTEPASPASQTGDSAQPSKGSTPNCKRHHHWMRAHAGHV